MTNAEVLKLSKEIHASIKCLMKVFSEEKDQYEYVYCVFERGEVAISLKNEEWFDLSSEIKSVIFNYKGKVVKSNDKLTKDEIQKICDYSKQWFELKDSDDVNNREILQLMCNLNESLENLRLDISSDPWLGCSHDGGTFSIWEMGDDWITTEIKNVIFDHQCQVIRSHDELTRKEIKQASNFAKKWLRSDTNI